MPLGSGSSAHPFAHLQAQNAALYRDVLDAFVRAKQRFTVHLRPEDVLVELGSGPSLETVTAALTQLAEWGNLRADPDTGRVTTVEDFHRARYLYQLSAEGHAAEQAIATYEEAIGRRGALQSVALSDIAAQLRALLVIAAEAAVGDPPDAAKTHLLMMSLVDRFTGLADNAQAFMASLRRAIDFADADLDAFIAYKEQLISYIERFIADLANRGAEIAALAHRIEAAGVLPLLEVAARREAADAAPGSENGEDAHDAAVHEAMEAWRQQWHGLRDWFVSADSSRQSQARLLRSAAIGAIRQLLVRWRRSTSVGRGVLTVRPTSGCSHCGSRRPPTTSRRIDCGTPPSGSRPHATSPRRRRPSPRATSSRYPRRHRGRGHPDWRSARGYAKPDRTSGGVPRTGSSTAPTNAGCSPSAPSRRPRRPPAPVPLSPRLARLLCRNSVRWTPPSSGSSSYYWATRWPPGIRTPAR
jgi:hypothetical protein